MAGSEAMGIESLGVLDLGKAAKLLSDISAVAEEGLLSSMQVVAKEEDFLQHAKSQVQSQAQVLLPLIESRPLPEIFADCWELKNKSPYRPHF